MVYVNDSDLIFAPKGGKQSEPQRQKKRIPEVTLRLSLENFDYIQAGMSDILTEVLVTASTAIFGGDPVAADLPHGHIQFGHGAGVGLIRDKSNAHGCLPYKRRFDGEALVVERGQCTFVEKLFEAAVAGASGVIALTEDEASLSPSASPEDIRDMDNSLDDVAIVTTARAETILVTAMLDSAELYGNQVRMVIVPTREPPPSVGEPGSTVPLDEQRTKAREGNRVLYLNGHPLLNTRLMA